MFGGVRALNHHTHVLVRHAIATASGGLYEAFCRHPQVHQPVDHHATPHLFDVLVTC